MVVLKVGNKEYKLKYGYRVLSTSNILDRISNPTGADENSNPLKEMMKVLTELVLAGMQKCHADEFGYETDSEKEECLNKIYDLLDQYEEENEDADAGFNLFNSLQEELEKNGFLSGVTKGLEEAMQKANATKVPMDHKKQSKK